MSAPTAIAAVTRTLAGVLETALHEEDASYRVTTLPLDKANAETQPANRLNLFLIQPAHNAALRNVNLTYAHRNGNAAQPPLAINLTYMITVYGEPGTETKDQRILGRALQCLNDHSTLLADDIRNHSPGSGLEDQVESVRVVPRDVSLEEMSRMWATFMTQYRTSAAYDVSVVLIDNTVLAPPSPSVLRRGEDDPGVFSQTGLPPVLTAIAAPELIRRGGQVIRQPAVRLGQPITLEGDRLPVRDAVLEVRSPGWGLRLATFSAVAPGPVPGTLRVMPTTTPPELDPPAGPPLAWAPGVYMGALVIRVAGRPDVSSNGVPFSVAPEVQVSPLNAAPGDVQLTVDCLPPPQAGQTLRLLLSGRAPVAATAVVPPAVAGQPARITFAAKALAAGEYLAVLRVDGVDSMPYRVRTLPDGGPTLEYDPAERVVIA